MLHDLLGAVFTDALNDTKFLFSSCVQIHVFDTIARFDANSLRRVLRAIRSPDPLTVEVVTLQCESAWCARKTAECREGNPFLCDGFCVSLCAYGVMLALLDSVSVAELVKFVFVLSLLRD
jgi:hypothetical protein